MSAATDRFRFETSLPRKPSRFVVKLLYRFRSMGKSASTSNRRIHHPTRQLPVKEPAGSLLFSRRRFANGTIGLSSIGIEGLARLAGKLSERHFVRKDDLHTEWWIGFDDLGFLESVYTVCLVRTGRLTPCSFSRLLASLASQEKVSILLRVINDLVIIWVPRNQADFPQILCGRDAICLRRSDH